MKYFSLTSIFILFLVVSVSAQSEYRFLSFKLGLTHNFLSPMPDSVPNLAIITPLGEYPLIPDNSGSGSGFTDYSTGIHAELLYHIDFLNEKNGLVIGAAFSNNAMQFQYVPLNTTKFWLVERYRMYSLGIPILFKLGDDIYEKQSYMYLGAQLNINMLLKQTQKVGTSEFFPNWGDEVSTQWIDTKSVKRGNAMAVLGFNFLIGSIELNYMLGSFFDSEYQNNEGYYPYRSFGTGVWAVKTSIHLPLSEWLIINSWQAEKLRRRFKFNSDIY